MAGEGAADGRDVFQSVEREQERGENASSLQSPPSAWALGTPIIISSSTNIHWGPLGVQSWPWGGAGTGSHQGLAMQVAERQTTQKVGHPN